MANLILRICGARGNYDHHRAVGGIVTFGSGLAYQPRLPGCLAAQSRRQRPEPEIESTSLLSDISCHSWPHLVCGFVFTILSLSLSFSLSLSLVFPIILYLLLLAQFMSCDCDADASVRNRLKFHSGRIWKIRPDSCSWETGLPDENHLISGWRQESQADRVLVTIALQATSRVS
jgi:hypothetical protein